jgi:hypothetical protein
MVALVQGGIQGARRKPASICASSRSDFVWTGEITTSAQPRRRGVCGRSPRSPHAPRTQQTRDPRAVNARFHHNRRTRIPGAKRGRHFTGVHVTSSTRRERGSAKMVAPAGAARSEARGRRTGARAAGRAANNLARFVENARVVPAVPEVQSNGQFLRWTPKVGQVGSLTQNQKNDPYVEETSSAQS